MIFEISDPCSWKMDRIKCDTDEFKILGTQIGEDAKYYQVAVSYNHYVIMREKKVWWWRQFRLAGVASNRYNDYPLIYTIFFSVRNGLKSIDPEELGHLENFPGRRWIKTPSVLYKTIKTFIQ